MRVRNKLALFLLLGVLAVACSENTNTQAAFDNERDRAGAGTRERPYESAMELAEQISERQTTGRSLEAVIVGRITAVEPGASFTWIMDEEIGEASRVELPFGDEEAMVNTAHLIVEVLEHLTPGDDRSETSVTVGIVVNADVKFDAIKADYESLDEVVLFLRPSAVFDYRPDIRSIYEDGALIGTLAEDGTVRFPLLAEPGRLLAGDDVIDLDVLRANR